MDRFWNFIPSQGSEDRTLIINGLIVDDMFEGETGVVTPNAFRNELFAGSGNITVWISSMGGSVFAASQMYTALKEYKGKVTVKIDGLVASAASVIAMSGDRILMSPVAMLMIHDPSVLCYGNIEEKQKSVEELKVVKKTIMNAYDRTGLPREQISELMREETYMDCNMALELNFIDDIIRGSQYKNLPVNSFLPKKLSQLNQLKALFRETPPDEEEKEPEAPPEKEPEKDIEKEPEKETVPQDKGFTLREAQARLKLLKTHI